MVTALSIINTVRRAQKSRKQGPKRTFSWMYEYTAFCNGPDEVKSPSDRHAAELTLLSVVGAEAATLCC